MSGGACGCIHRKRVCIPYSAIDKGVYILDLGIRVYRLYAL